MGLFLDVDSNESGLYIPQATYQQELLLNFNGRDGNFRFGAVDLLDSEENPLELLVLLVGTELFYGNYYDYTSYTFMKIAFVPIMKVERLGAERPCLYTLFLKGDSMRNVSESLRKAPGQKLAPGQSVARLYSKVMEKTTSDNKKVKVRPLFVDFAVPNKTEKANITRFRSEVEKNQDDVLNLLRFNSGLNVVWLDGINDAEIKREFDSKANSNNSLFTVDDFGPDQKALPASSF